MSEEKNNNITEKLSTSLEDKNKNHKIKQTIQISLNEQSIKTQTGKYKYVYSNTNSNKIIKENINVNINNNNIKENSNLKNNVKYNNNIKKNINNKINNNIYLNSKNISKKEIISENHKNQSPANLKNNCETNYSINKASNIKYVNGSNKEFSQINFKGNPQLLNHNYSEKVIHTKKRSKFIKGENSEKCICDKNVKCICGKRIKNKNIYEKGKIMNLNKVNNNILNPNKKIIRRNYYVNTDNINNLNAGNINNLNNHNLNIVSTDNMNAINMKTVNINTTNENTTDILTVNANNNTMKNIKKFERNINVETFPVFFSDEDINSNRTSKLYTNKRIIKYSFPINYRNNRHIKISRYFKDNSNTVDEIRTHRKIENMNLCHTNNMNFYSPQGRDYNKKNHKFTSICNCSYKSIDSNKNRINSFSSEKRNINLLSGSNSKYKYNISIRNINVNKGMNRSTSYGDIKSKKYRYSNEEYYKRTNIQKIVQSQDKKKLKMQNAQNMQILQEPELFRILVPILPNEIENSCNFQISGKEKNQYSIEEINELKKRKITQKTEIIEENKNKPKDKYYNNLANKEIIQINTLKVKKPNWNETNKTTKLSCDFSSKKVKKPKKELNKEQFEINIPDNGRKFKGDFYIENNIIEYEKQEKDPNANLLLSPNHKISFKAEYPRRNWNNITKPISDKPLSIEGKPRQIVLERSVEKIMSIKGKKPKKIINDWNLSNDEKKEVNINLYTKKKKQKLSKERIQPFVIKGKEKNKFFIPKKELNIFIKGIEKENPEEVIINDDYNQIPRKYNKLHANIKKVYEISDESSSEFDILKDLKMCNEQNNEYKQLIINSLNNAGKEKQKVIINEIKGVFPNGIETYEGKRKVKIEFNNVLKQNVNVNENLYSKKKVIINSKKNISQTEPRPIPKKDLNINLQENIPETKVIYREIISSEKPEVNNENQQNKENMTDYQEDEKDNPTSDINSQKSQTKYSYREQIISMSPNRNDNQIDIISNNLSYQSFNQIGFNENQNDEFFSNSNFSPNSTDKKTNNMQNNENESPFKNNMDNGKNYFYIEKNEQEVPRIQDEEPNIMNNYSQQMNERSSKNQKQIQYIFKKENQPKSKEEKLNTNNEHILRNANFQNISKIEKFNNNNNNNYNNNINSQYSNNNYNNNDNNYIIHYNNYPEQEQSNIITQKQIIQRTIISQNQNNINNNNININQINGTNNISTNNSEIINRDYLNNINKINNLNNINLQQQQIDLSKSQEIPSLFKQSKSPGQRKQKYENFIQEYSKHLMTNPSDNFNNFSINKLNIMPVSAGQYGNIILNNTASTSQNYYMKQRESRESHENNDNYKINGSNSEMRNNSEFSFGVNYEFDKNTNKKVKLLKP